MGIVALSENYKVERDRYNWMLHSAYIGKDRNGNAKTHWHTTYHADFRQIANRICTHEAEAAQSLADMVQSFDSAAERIESAMQQLADQAQEQGKY